MATRFHKIKQKPQDLDVTKGGNQRLQFPRVVYEQVDQKRQINSSSSLSLEGSFNSIIQNKQAQEPLYRLRRAWKGNLRIA